ncbi:MAG: damage-inducible protein DinB [Alphaproteobacteria bacterium HGW-Alphaproteobacteria-2]|nr:MAG: damage-inducible protein DinB [Alphaproteobacteria bacterium HGW-Alphaproteobacteria-2]
MISADFCRTMARYGTWQNDSLLAAADTLDDAARRADMGAFWGSIEGTLAHLLWGDRMWMARFDGWDLPAERLADSARAAGGWTALKAARAEADARILDWAGQLADADLAHDLTWHSAVLGRQVHRPKWLLVQHFFNHQTHHRGQVHAMLTAAGAPPVADTDLFLMPESP